MENLVLTGSAIFWDWKNEMKNSYRILDILEIFRNRKFRRFENFGNFRQIFGKLNISCSRIIF